MCMCSHLFVGVCVQSLRSGGHREHVNDLSNFVELSEDEAVVREQQKKRWLTFIVIAIALIHFNGQVESRLK